MPPPLTKEQMLANQLRPSGLSLPTLRGLASDPDLDQTLYQQAAPVPVTPMPPSAPAKVYVPKRMESQEAYDAKVAADNAKAMENYLRYRARRK